MINRGPNLLIPVLIGALGGAVALSAGIAQSLRLSPRVSEVGNICYGVDALSILIVVSLVGDRRLKATMKRFVSEKPLAVFGALRALANIGLRYPRGATSVLRIRNRHVRN